MRTHTTTLVAATLCFLSRLASAAPGQTMTSTETEATPAVAAPGQVAPRPAPGPSGYTFWGGLPWGGWSVGGRYMMPLPLGPILQSSSVRDSWAVELGLDYLHLGDSYGPYDISYNELLPVAGMMWNIWFSDNFALYPKLELGYAYAWFSSDYGPNVGGYGGLFLSGAAGLLYKMDNGLAIRAEAGVSGLKAGLAWLF
jgi:hypothetical protein